MTRNRSCRATVGALALVLTGYAGLALADEFNVQHTVLSKFHLSEPKNVDHVEVQRLDFAPGATSGLHQHPGPLIAYVISGSIVVQVNDGKTMTYSAGQSLYEASGTRITRFDNGSKSTPAKVVATYLLAREDHEVTLRLD